MPADVLITPKPLGEYLFTGLTPPGVEFVQIYLATDIVLMSEREIFMYCQRIKSLGLTYELLRK